MDRPYVGIDFHRRRSVIVRLSAAGEKLWSIRVANDPLAIAEAVPDPEVVVEATYGGMGGRTAPCQRRPCPSGEPAGPLLGAAVSQERRARRHRPGRHVAPGPAAGGVDRPAGDPGCR
jgi:hypothetical protein